MCMHIDSLLAILVSITNYILFFSKLSVYCRNVYLSSVNCFEIHDKIIFKSNELKNF